MDNNKKNPIIRFEEFKELYEKNGGDSNLENPYAWEQRKLGEVGSVVMCKRIFKDQTTAFGDIPFYKIGTFGGNPDSFIPNELFEEYKKNYPYPEIGDILMSASGTIGRTIVYEGEKAYYQDSNIVWLKTDKSLIDNSFLKQFYQVVKWSGLEGSTIKRLYNSNILSTGINLPSLKEQTKLGTFFNQLDNTIALQQRKVDKILNLKKAMLEKMFPKDGEKIPEVRFEKFKKLYEENGGDSNPENPYAWEQRKLSSMTNYKNGKSHEDKQSTSGKLELINLNSISISGGLKHSGKFIDEADDTLQKDDLVMILSDVGHGDLLGRVALIPKDDRFVLNQRVALLRPNTTADPQFLFSYINAHQYYFKAQGAGMSQLNISKGSVENFISFVPIIEEQKKIGAFFKQIDDTIALQQHKLTKLKNIKKALLKKMFI